MNAGPSPREAITMNNSTKLLAITSLALFFLAGVFAGIIVDRKVLFPAGLEGRGDPPGMRDMPGGGQRGPGPQERGDIAARVRRDFLDKLTNGLSLTDDQVTKVTAILDENEKEFEKLRSHMREGLAGLDYNLFNRISAELNEKQKKLLLSEWMSPFHPSGQGGPEGGQGGRPGGPPPGQGGMEPSGPPPGRGGRMGGEEIPPQVAPGALDQRPGAPGADQMQQRRLNLPGRQNSPECAPPGGAAPQQGSPPKGPPPGR